MQVHEPAALVLGDLDVGDAHELAQPLLRHPGLPRERARQVDRSVRRHSSPSALFHSTAPWWSKHSRQSGSPRHGVVLVVHARAGEPDAVLADRRVAARPAAPRLPVRAERARVDGPKLGAVSVTNTRRVLGHRVGDALAAAQAGGDQVVGVLAVALRARRADGLAAVPARLAQHPSGSVSVDHTRRRPCPSQVSIVPRRRTGRAQ